MHIDPKAFLSQSFQRFGLCDVGQSRSVLWRNRVVAVAIAGAALLIAQRIATSIWKWYCQNPTPPDPVSKVLPKATPNTFLEIFVDGEKNEKRTSMLKSLMDPEEESSFHTVTQKKVLTDHPLWKEIHLCYIYNHQLDRFVLYLQGVENVESSSVLTYTITNGSTKHRVPMQKACHQAGDEFKGTEFGATGELRRTKNPHAEFLSVGSDAATLLRNGVTYTIEFDASYSIAPMTVRIDRSERVEGAAEGLAIAAENFDLAL